jgi:phospholipid transport system substrate-binding protein
MRKLKWVIFIGLLCTSLIAWATGSPVDMVKSVSDQVLTRLKAERGSIKANPNRVYTIVDQVLLPHVDFEEMSRRVLALAWRNAKPGQRAQFQREFSKLVVRTYAGALNAYTDQTIQFLPLRSSPGNTVEVRTLIHQSGGSPIPVNYRLIRSGGEWKVYDLVIEGVSLVNSFRSQFAEPIRQQGLDKVIVDIADRNRRGVTARE